MTWQTGSSSSHPEDLHQVSQEGQEVINSELEKLVQFLPSSAHSHWVLRVGNMSFNNETLAIRLLWLYNAGPNSLFLFLYILSFSVYLYWYLDVFPFFSLCVYIYISVLGCLYIYCFCTNFKMFMAVINASFLTLHIFSYYNHDHPTSLAFKFCWLSNYCMWLCIVLITNYISFKFF